MAGIQVEKPDIVQLEVGMVHGDDGASKQHSVEHIDGFNVLGLNQEDADFYRNFSKKERDIARHKVDIRLVPLLALLYLMSHLDRSNIGNTKIEGIGKGYSPRYNLCNHFSVLT